MTMEVVTAQPLQDLKKTPKRRKGGKVSIGIAPRPRSRTFPTDLVTLSGTTAGGTGEIDPGRPWLCVCAAGWQRVMLLEISKVRKSRGGGKFYDVYFQGE